MRYNPKKHHLPPFKMDGILLVNKPTEWTSFDVVNFLRNRFNIPKIGHCGTLDPAATGLLVIVMGKFTTLSQKFSGEDKPYEAEVLLGQTTTTEDMEGEITSTADTSHLTQAAVEEAINSFLGKSKQIPPMVSAIKKDGKKLYELARQGIEIERDPRDIEISEIKIHSINIPEFHFTVKCSKGTYIRTLATDIGAKLGVGGTLKSLHRTQSGIFTVDDAVTIEELKEMEQPDLLIKMRTFLTKVLDSKLI